MEQLSGSSPSLHPAAPLSLFIGIVFLVVSLIIFSFFIIDDVNAHPPEDMVIEYDFESRTLNVTITHPVDDPNTHFIEKVKVERNNEDILEQEYSSQPEEDTFTYPYTVEAVDGDTLEVVAECNIDGEILRQITVHGEDRPMDISHSPQPNELEEGSQQEFIITIGSEGNPVEKANVVVDPTSGDVITPVEGEPGEYSFNYTAPRVRTKISVWINVTATKNGYQDAELSIQLNVTNIPGSNVILIHHSPILGSIDEGTIQQFSLSLEADTEPLETAQLSIISNHGNISNIDGLGSGEYSFLFEAPTVNSNLSVSITINATKDGFENGTHIVILTIVDVPPPPLPLIISIVTMNTTMFAGSSQDITLFVGSEGMGVKNLSLTLAPTIGTHTIGIVTNLTDRGNGLYEFQYLSPDVDVDTLATINVTAARNGFETGYLDLKITIRIIPVEPINLLCIKLFPDDDLIVEATTVNFTLYILFDCDPFEGALVELSYSFGAVTNIVDQGGGKFTFSYLAPMVGTETQEIFVINGTKTDYGSYSREFSFTIVKGTSTEIKGDGTETRSEYPGLEDPGGDPTEKNDPAESYPMTPFIVLAALVVLVISFVRKWHSTG